MRYGMPPHGVRGVPGPVDRGVGHEHVRGGRRRLVVEALHRREAAVRPVREEHEGQRRAVVVQGLPALPERSARVELGDRGDEPVVLGVGLGQAGTLGDVLVPALVPLDPVGQERGAATDVDERPQRSTVVSVTAVPIATKRGVSGRHPICWAANQRASHAAPDELGDAQPHDQEDAQVPERQDPKVPGRGGLDLRPHHEQQAGHRGEGDDDERRRAAPDDAAHDRHRGERTAAPHCHGRAPCTPNRYDQGNRNCPYWVMAA